MRGSIRFQSALRVVSVSIIVVGVASLAKPAAAQPENGFCNEYSDAIGTFHAFQSPGACYQGAPNGVHGDYQLGYCHQYHYTCVQ